MSPLAGSLAALRGHVSAILSAILLIGLGGAGRARAEPSTDDKALATILFKEGRALMAEGRIPLACPKFEESHRLDPSGGTILNLALCHEQQGLLARSWTELNEAAAFARRDRRPDREALAVARARALEPRLSRLTIVVPESARTEGLRIERDGREVGQPSWSTPMPVDGGEHVVGATALGKVPFTSTVVVANEGDAQTVEIPALGATPVVATPRATSAVPTVVSAPPILDHSPEKRNLRRALGWTVGGAGLLQLGVAGTFVLRAVDKQRQSDLACPGGRCDLNGASLSDQAGSAADTATVLTVTGLASVATGIYLLATSPRASTARADTRPILRMAISGNGSMIGLQGSF